jgi:hypothetical protein
MGMGLQNSTLQGRSQQTGKTQTSIQPYALWEIDVEFPKMSRDEAGPWISFFAQLRGKGGSFTFPIPGTSVPLSGYTGAVGTVNGASQTGYSLITAGWANNTLILKQGDVFNPGNGELKVVRADVTSGVAGAATITFDPPLRASPVTTTALVINSPTVILASTKDTPKWKVGHPVLTKFQMKCLENF